MADDDERRHGTRTPARKLACITTPDGTVGMYELVDLSPGGMRIKTNGDGFSVDDNFEVELEIDQRSIEVSARVAHVDGDEAGVEFLNITPEDSAQLEVMVLEHGWSSTF